MISARNPMRANRTIGAALGVIAGMVVLSGCRFDGVNSLPLPGTAVQGDSVEVVIQMNDIQNLVNNSVVKAGNVDVGSIKNVDLDGWDAKLTVELNSTADLPANVSVTLGQTSILGAQYLELTVPPGQESGRKLRDGDVISLRSTDAYPSTDQVLAAVSAVLNGSGLEQLQTITTELNHVMDGRQDTLRSLIGNLQTLAGGLNAQRDNIVRTIDSIDRLAGTLGTQTATIDKGLTTLNPALGVLNTQQTQLTGMLDSLGRFGDIANQVLTSSHADLTADLQNLQPALTELAASGTNLADALDIALTLPFPVSTTDRTFRGDFINLYLTLDLSANGILNKVLPSIPKGLAELAYSATQAANPFLAPTIPTPVHVPPPAGPAPAAPETGTDSGGN